MSENWDVEKRVLIGKILKDCEEDATEEKVNEWYDYLKTKLDIYHVSKDDTFMRVFKSRLYGRAKWMMLDCPINKLKIIQAKRETYKRPYFIEVLKQIG